MPGVLRMAAALLAVVLLFGLVLGAGQVVADSLPGGPLYELKLAAERVRLALTTDPQASADLNLALAEERLDEIVLLLERGQSLDGAASHRAEQQLAQALEAAVQLEDPAAAQMLQQLVVAVQQRQGMMAAAMAGLPDVEQEPAQRILREMERVRQEAHAGQADPAGLRQRLRYGTPPLPTEEPGLGRTPEPSPSREQPGVGPHPSPTGGPARPQPTAQPTRGPSLRPRPTDTRPSAGAGEPTGPRPTEPPGEGPGQSPQPTVKPSGSTPTAQPGPGPSPQPTTGSGGATTEPPGPPPQPTERQGGAELTQQPDPGPQPSGEPGGDPGSGPPSTAEPGSGNGSGGGKP